MWMTRKKIFKCGYIWCLPLCNLVKFWRSTNKLNWSKFRVKVRIYNSTRLRISQLHSATLWLLFAWYVSIIAWYTWYFLIISINANRITYHIYSFEISDYKISLIDRIMFGNYSWWIAFSLITVNAANAIANNVLTFRIPF